MPRGGARPGAGCPKGLKRSKRIPERILTPAEKLRNRVQSIIDAGDTPVEFALGVMRSIDSDTNLRLEAARIAAPYVHRKQPEERIIQQTNHNPPRVIKVIDDYDPGTSPAGPA